MSNWEKVRRRIEGQGLLAGLSDAFSRFYWVCASRAVTRSSALPSPPPVILEQVQSVLVIKYYGIGNAVLALPALRSLREALPAARFFLLTDGRSLPLMKNSKLFEHILILPLSELDPGKALAQTISSIQRVHPDLIFCSFPLLAPRLTEWFKYLRARWIIGYEGDGPSSVFSQQLPLDTERHETQLNLDLIRALGITPAVEAATIDLEEPDRSEADRYLSQQSGGPPWYAFHCGSFADMIAKRWPAEAFAALGDRLVEKHGGRVIIVGAVEESELAAGIAARMKYPAVNAAGRLSLLGTAALLNRSSLVVSNDSGLMHLAAAVGAPLAALFGPTQEKKNAPWAPADRAIILRSGRDCSPCHRVGQPITCPDPECMKQLTVDQVEAAIDQTGWLEAIK